MNNWEVYAREIRDMDPYVHLILIILYFVALSPLNKHNEKEQVKSSIKLACLEKESTLPSLVFN